MGQSCCLTGPGSHLLCRGGEWAPPLGSPAQNLQRFSRWRNSLGKAGNSVTVLTLLERKPVLAPWFFKALLCNDVILLSRFGVSSRFPHRDSDGYCPVYVKLRVPCWKSFSHSDMGCVIILISFGIWTSVANISESQGMKRIQWPVAGFIHSSFVILKKLLNLSLYP